MKQPHLGSQKKGYQQLFIQHSPKIQFGALVLALGPRPIITKNANVDAHMYNFTIIYFFHLRVNQKSHTAYNNVIFLQFQNLKPT